MITNIAEIETSLGLEAGQLTEMITSDEEKELDLSDKSNGDKNELSELNELN